MNLLVQVGKATWVDPDTIEAIEWGQMCNAPMIILKSGQHVYALNFKDHGLDNMEARTNELLAFIKQAVRETPAAVSYGVM